MNAKKHGFRVDVDPCSSALFFDRFVGRGATAEERPTRPSATWLARVGWLAEFVAADPATHLAIRSAAQALSAEAAIAQRAVELVFGKHARPDALAYTLRHPSRRATARAAVMD